MVVRAVIDFMRMSLRPLKRVEKKEIVKEIDPQKIANYGVFSASLGDRWCVESIGQGSKVAKIKDWIK
jgi:hypothetical protein